MGILLLDSVETFGKRPSQSGALFSGVGHSQIGRTAIEDLNTANYIWVTATYALVAASSSTSAMTISRSTFSFDTSFSNPVKFSARSFDCLFIVS